MLNLNKAQMLRRMRREAKINQADLAEIIGVCRETVINIEKDNHSALQSMSLVSMVKWFKACRKSTPRVQGEFQDYINSLFNG